MKISEVKGLPALGRLLYWVTERETIRLKKEAGLPRPWTDDHVLDTFYFCNVNRQDDKVTRWFSKEWYGPYRNHPSILAACCLARLVNSPGPLGRVTQLVFDPKGPDWGTIADCLRRYHETEGPVFNGAYIIAGCKGEAKIDTVVRRCRQIHEAAPPVDTSSMERTHATLMGYEGVGSFVGGQIVADLRWAMTGTWLDKFVWAPYGPGSTQGMDRLLSENFTREVPRYDFLAELRKVMAVYRGRLPAAITDRLEAQSAQSTLCEFSKYEKGLWGDARVKRRYNGGTVVTVNDDQLLG